MQRTLLAIAICAALGAGCAGGKKAPPTAATQPGRGAPTANSGARTNQTLIVTPETALVGKVALFDANGRYVVLNFPIGQIAAVDQRLNVYRRGLKVGEVKVTGPQRENNIVADVVAGEAAVGDEARSQ